MMVLGRLRKVCRWKGLPLLALIFIAATASCQSRPAAGIAFAPTGNPIFSLDYSQASRDMCWPDSEPYGDFFCQGGELQLVHHGPGGMAGIYFNEPILKGLRDFMLEAQMRSVDETGAYGVQFGDNGLNESYIFRVRSTGAFELIIWSQSGEKVLFPWTASPSINRGHTENLLQVTAQDSQIAVFANGEKLASLENDVLPGGWPGVAAMDGGRAAVKSVRVWKLP